MLSCPENNSKIKISPSLLSLTAAFGGLDLNGAPRGNSWTQLSQTANAGDTQLILEAPMDWVVNDVIVLAPTSYNTWEAEKLTITAVSADKMTVTFTPALQYKHIGNILKLFSILLPLFKKIISNF